MDGRMLPMDSTLINARMKPAGQVLEALATVLGDNPNYDGFAEVGLPDGLDAEDARTAVDFVIRLLLGLISEMNEGELWIVACTCCTEVAVFCERCGNPGPLALVESEDGD